MFLYVTIFATFFTYLLTYGAEPFLRSCLLCSHSRTSQHFKEPEGASPCSQEPSTGPYPEPDWSSPRHSLLYSILIFFSASRSPYVETKQIVMFGYKIKTAEETTVGPVKYKVYSFFIYITVLVVEYAFLSCSLTTSLWSPSYCFACRHIDSARH
jgi:hypothetical protein